MTRRMTLAALALCLLAPLAAQAKTTDAAVKAKVESAVKQMEVLVKTAAKDTAAQTTFRTGVIALRAAQQARRAGELDEALALATKGEQAAENKSPPSLAALQKDHSKWVPPSVAKVPADFATLSKNWKQVGQLLPETIMHANKIIPDTIMETGADKP